MYLPHKQMLIAHFLCRKVSAWPEHHEVFQSMFFLIVNFLYCHFICHFLKFYVAGAFQRIIANLIILSGKLTFQNQSLIFYNLKVFLPHIDDTFNVISLLHTLYHNFFT